MRTPLLFLLRFLLGAVLAWGAGRVLVAATDASWHRLGGRDPVAPLHAFMHEPAQVDLVFFGTSSTRNAVVPGVLEEALAVELGETVSVWNLALPNATPEIGRILAEEFFDEAKPRFLVLEAAPFLWDGDRGEDADFSVYWRWFSDPGSWMQPDRPLRRQDALPYLRNLGRDWEDLWSACRIVRIESLRTDMLSIPPQGGRYLVSGLDEPLRGASVEKGSATREARRVGHYSTPQLWQDELERILAACEARGIGVILLHQPMYPRLLPMFEEGSYEAFLEWIQGVAAAKGLPLLLLQDEIELDTLDYRDYIHYSPQGARHFSEELAPWLAPLLKESDG